ncbi:glycosyltransferase family 4 protein [uncultured Psychroserpens sp.]|uniref:glycosyltransferase family 4 protein n=1 Tax=uncultured Psychroserpens sp. TaxID=255436 RepID=UPI00262D5EC6|nr:glycosyltransferase family 4 protein [uncultured Psychroserpens sp.]
MSFKKRILIVTSEFPPQPGGIGNHARNLAKALHNKGYQMQVLSDQRSYDGLEEQKFDNSEPYDIKRIKRHRLRILMYVQRILVLFRSLKSNDIIIASGKFSLWIVAFVSLFYRKSYLAVTHGTEVNFENKVLSASITKALKRFDQIIAVSNFTKEIIIEKGLSKITVIPNGIDYLQFQSKEISPDNLTGNPSLVTVGNVTERKGQLNVIRHLSVLKTQFPELHYHCVGLPTNKEEFLKVAERLGVEDHVTFHGRVSEERLVNILSNTDIFIMLSSVTDTGDVEGFGIAIIEANAIGVPAIGSKGCGIEDAINNNTTGILIDPKDSDAFLKAIETITINYESFSKSAQQWAKDHDWSVLVNAYTKLIN